MPTCASCGAENPASNRFCGSCGAPLAGAEPARETRKTVTVVFCDVTGSTALGERLDPESLRRVMARYFDAMRAAIERHGGTVEKFIGDAVMAVFGVPVLHEDDALRALRAAAEMRERLGELNAELQRDYGTTLQLRTGVNTGEVVTGTAERLVTGDAVNVAARLEQAAQPGEILVGAEAVRLARDAIEVEELPPLELKGKAEGVPAFRLLGVAAGAPGLARRLDAPMVGRDRERRLLRDAWERAVSERACLLFTLLGPAGVGKSRLVADFRERVDATVVEGRCLSYGEGITYWPVVEVVKQLPQAQELGLDDASAAAISSLLGESEQPTTPGEIARAFRKLVEASAARRPLVVLFDDVHWGEPAFLDLVRHVADLSRGAPILLLCSARPELLERAPHWGGGTLNATAVLLEPLSAEETGELIGRLAGGSVGAELSARIRAASEGNPLFVEEMVAMAGESGGADLTVPPTIQALLAARIDQLDPSERGVLARGSVEGQVFHLGAVQALAPEEPEPAGRVTALVRKELVRPEQPLLPAEDAYRFRHLLIRDAAYDALPKASRAALHERFADWLDERGRDLVERDEIVGYHLEQAYRYRTELGPADEHAAELARRAAARLLAGGRVAHARHDAAGATALLGRAAALMPATDPARPDLLTDLAEALFDHGDIQAALERADEAIRAAESLGDEPAAMRARLRRLAVQAMADPEFRGSEIIPELERMIESLEQLGDAPTLTLAWGFLGRLRFFAGHARDAEACYARAVEYAKRAGKPHYENAVRMWWAGAKRHGAAPADEAAAFIEELTDLTSRSVGLEAYRLALTAALHAFAGRFDDARSAMSAAEQIELELGLEIRHFANATEAGRIEILAGNTERAVEMMRIGYEGLGRLGEMGFRSTCGTTLAEALVDLGRDAEAEPILRECEEMAQAEDFDPQARLRATRARILARRGELEEAERLAREAVEIMARTDYIDETGSTLVALADVLEAAGRRDEAAEVLREALGLFERKGNLVLAGQTRDRLDALRAATA